MSSNNTVPGTTAGHMYGINGTNIVLKLYNKYVLLRNDIFHTG